MTQKEGNKTGVTEDDLAQMVARGFDGTNEKIDRFQGETRERFDAIENRLQTLESIIDLLRKDIAEIHKE